VALLQAEVKRLKQELMKSAMLQTADPMMDRRLSILPSQAGPINASVDAPAGKKLFWDYPLKAIDANNRAVLYATLDRLKQVEKAGKQLEKKIESLQGLVDSKDKLIQSKQMMLRLRDSRISKLEAGYEFPYFEEVENLKEEIRLLQEQVKNNPDLIRFAMENLDLRGFRILPIYKLMNRNY
jgi:hypothetical protein